MNQLVRDWVRSLRSGEYQQTEAHARSFGRLHENGRYSALGVLGHLCGMEPFNGKHAIGMLYEPNNCGYSVYLPDAVLGATGLAKATTGAVVRRNNEGQDFAQIADFIEAQAQREDLIRVLDAIEALPELYRMAALSYGYDILEYAREPDEARKSALQYASGT